MKKMRAVLIGVALSLPSGPSAATPGDAAPAKLTGILQPADLGRAADRPCGTSADSDGAGGWKLYWNNCWGETGKELAPVWHNGRGNSYVNLVCQHIPSGQVRGWHVPKSALPPEPANYTTVIFCLR